MKAKILLLVLAMMGTSLVFSQKTIQENTKNCEQKVLKKIKRKLNLIKVSDFLEEGTKTKVIVSCVVNDDKVVEITHIEGFDKSLKAAIMDNMERHPVKCETLKKGEEFSFILTFKMLS